MDERHKKNALRMIPYGIYLIGSCHGDQRHVFIGSWLMQISFTPPLVAIGVRESNQSLALIRQSGVFGVSIFGADQKRLASRFLRKPKFEGDTVNDVPYTVGTTGVPILVDVPAHFECRVVQEIQQGDHALFIGEVIHAHAPQPSEALTTVNTGWKYGG